MVSLSKWIWAGAVVVAGALVFVQPSADKSVLSARPIARFQQPVSSLPPTASVATEANDIAPGATRFDRDKLHLTLSRWREARSTDSEDELERLTKELVELLTDENVAQVVPALSAEERDTPFTLIALQRWMRVDPMKATTWVADQAGNPENQLVATAAEAWAADRAGLLTYVDQLPDSPWKQTFVATAGLELSLKDPQGAIDLAQRLKPGETQTQLLQAVACDWISRDPTVALDWIIDIHEPQLREQLTVAASKSYALTEPGLAAAWLMATVESETMKRDAVLNIVDTWATKDPEKGANWVAATLEGDTQASALEIILSHWTKSDSVAARTWLETRARVQKQLVN